MRKVHKLIGITAVLFAFILQTMVLSAETMTMKQLQEIYEKQTGKDWDRVTSEERKKFISNFVGSKKKAAREKRIGSVNIPFHIRESFKKKKGRKWEDATEEEQKDFKNI